ncbi:zinc-binding alcohol dehydrogenase [uncultured Microbacterium sp.]|uniref:zinc-binding alcohol dehydrogenase n=1 Tax=uncultured Microbacterium sp. TaxID=191216 RepID=UPI002639C249|nr:zinc-binding alcohol dehydrogenase [uncultured Microbacterium sp.]
MSAAGGPEWVVREDAGLPVLIALYLRQVLGIRFPEELPHVRGIAPHGPHEDEDDPALERQWRGFWELTVEPQAHPSPVPLELVDGFDMLIALPTEGFAELHAAIVPHGKDAVAFARSAHDRYRASLGTGTGTSYRAYAGAIAQHERHVGRRAHSFELNVQVLPLTQRGVWWIGSLTVAVTDGLRSDIAAFDAAIGPIIADIA